MAAIIAQKKLLEWSEITKPTVPRHKPSPHDLRGEEIRDLLQTKQDTADGRTEGNGNTGGRSGT